METFQWWANVDWFNKIYIPGLAKAAYQRQIKSIESKKKNADDTHKDMKVIKFPIVLKTTATLISKIYIFVSNWNLNQTKIMKMI